MKLFQYSILFIPKDRGFSKNGKNLTIDKAQILKEPTSVLACDEKSALLIAARQIPEGYLDRLDEIEVALRPF